VCLVTSCFDQSFWYCNICTLFVLRMWIYVIGVYYWTLCVKCLSIEPREISACDCRVFHFIQVQDLVRENSELRSIIQHAGISLPHLSFSSLFASPLPNGHEAETEPVVDARSSRSSQRPASMYEPREGLLRSGSQSPHIHHCISSTAHTGKWDKNQVLRYLSYNFLAFLC